MSFIYEDVSMRQYIYDTMYPRDKVIMKQCILIFSLILISYQCKIDNINVKESVNKLTPKELIFTNNADEIVYGIIEIDEKMREKVLSKIKENNKELKVSNFNGRINRKNYILLKSFENYAAASLYHFGLAA